MYTLQSSRRSVQGRQQIITCAFRLSKHALNDAAPLHGRHLSMIPRQDVEESDIFIHMNRRSVLVSEMAGAMAFLGISGSMFPATASDSLPSGYEDTARSLISVLRESVEADLSGAPEKEVRRKADPAKDLVRRFLTNWQDSSIVKNDESYQLLTVTIQDLGKFYSQKGQRARLDSELGRSILDRLDKAEGALPPAPEKKSLFPF